MWSSLYRCEKRAEFSDALCIVQNMFTAMEMKRFLIIPDYQVQEGKYPVSPVFL